MPKQSYDINYLVNLALEKFPQISLCNALKAESGTHHSKEECENEHAN